MYNYESIQLSRHKLWAGLGRMTGAPPLYQYHQGSFQTARIVRGISSLRNSSIFGKFGQTNVKTREISRNGEKPYERVAPLFFKMTLSWRRRINWIFSFYVELCFYISTHFLFVCRGKWPNNPHKVKTAIAAKLLTSRHPKFGKMQIDQLSIEVKNEKAFIVSVIPFFEWSAFVRHWE